MSGYTLKTMKMFFSLFASIYLLACSQAVNAVHGPHPAERQDPEQSLQSILDKISAFHNSGDDKNAQALLNFIEHDIMPGFAFAAMARSIAGPYARFMTAHDHADFVTQIKTSLRNILTEHLGSFDPEDSSVDIEKTRFTRTNEASVAVRVSFQQRRAVTLSFRMQLVNHQWKVVDIRSNGTSLVLYYRARFIDQLREYRSSALSHISRSSACGSQDQDETC